MRKIITLFLSFAFVFAAFTVFDVGKISANPVQDQTVEAAVKFSPVAQAATVNFSNRPRTAAYSLNRPDRAAHPSAIKFERKPPKYGFRLSHKNYYPPENRL